jgi:acetyl esterase/lipase
MSIFRRDPCLDLVHPELRRSVRFLPRVYLSGQTKWLMRMALPLIGKHGYTAGISLQRFSVARGHGLPSLRLRIHRPAGSERTPALLWIHGGGHVLGSDKNDDLLCSRYARDLGITVIVPDYRLSPEHPFPADLHDCYTALLWAVHSHESLGIDPERIAIGGGSAGGGLAAALAHYAHDRREVNPCFQLLVYPMLDDRTVLRTDIDERGFYLWHSRSNTYAWRVYMGTIPGADSVPEYSVPARREDLANLPPAWIGVGTLDLFHDEDIAYARRLQECGVACELKIAEGAFHGFDTMAPQAPPSLEFYQSQLRALKRALF